MQVTPTHVFNSPSFTITSFSGLNGLTSSSFLSGNSFIAPYKGIWNISFGLNSTVNQMTVELRSNSGTYGTNIIKRFFNVANQQNPEFEWTGFLNVGDSVSLLVNSGFAYTITPSPSVYYAIALSTRFSNTVLIPGGTATLDDTFPPTSTSTTTAPSVSVVTQLYAPSFFLRYSGTVTISAATNIIGHPNLVLQNSKLIGVGPLSNVISGSNLIAPYTGTYLISYIIGQNVGQTVTLVSSVGTYGTHTITVPTSGSSTGFAFWNYTIFLTANDRIRLVSAPGNGGTWNVRLHIALIHAL